MLSGHAHAGQLNVRLVGPLHLPRQATRRLLKDHARVGSKQLYVSRGIGAAGLWFRWRARPEVPIIVLRAADV